MSHATVAQAVSRHVPCSHMEWPDDDRTFPGVPFACYILDYDSPICVDNEQIAVRHKWMVELYEKRRDKDLEKALGDTLREEFGAVRRDESWIENDNLLVVTYTFYEIEGEFDG